jgi:hypothetical protein
MCLYGRILPNETVIYSERILGAILLDAQGAAATTAFGKKKHRNADTSKIISLIEYTRQHACL